VNRVALPKGPAIGTLGRDKAYRPHSESEGFSAPDDTLYAPPGARGAKPRSGREGTARGEPTAARPRFLRLDSYRVAREWQRLEGTPQRELFRDLRARFLARHPAGSGRWAADVGSGPGRFAAQVTSAGGRTVLLDLSQHMLVDARRRLESRESADAPFRYVRADAVSLPFRSESIARIVSLGNALGFAGGAGERLLSELCGAVSMGGPLIVEAVAGPGESSVYLSRLPPGAVRRLLAAPVRAVVPRVEREGFRSLALRRSTGSGFRRWTPGSLASTLARHGLRIEECAAVAPALGSDPARIAAVRGDAKAWSHLLELEEVLGRSAPRVAHSAGYLLAARKGPGAQLDAH
jgi:SAM-dependent methyltransferase